MDFVSAIRCAVLYGRYGAALWATFESKRVALLLQVDNMSRRRVNDAKDIVTYGDRMVATLSVRRCEQVDRSVLQETTMG